MTTIRIKLPTIEQVEFTLTADFEEIPVRGNAVVSGDDEADRASEDRIIERLNNGDVWAWASVKMEAKFRGIAGYDYLGCCSYEDAEDFKAGGYYDDMRKCAFDDLICHIKELAARD